MDSFLSARYSLSRRRSANFVLAFLASVVAITLMALTARAWFGDIIRNAKADNVAQQFAKFIFRQDDGTPLAFSQSGEHGRYEIRSPAKLQYPNYETIRGRNKGDSGY